MLIHPGTSVPLCTSIIAFHVNASGDQCPSLCEEAFLATVLSAISLVSFLLPSVQPLCWLCRLLRCVPAAAPAAADVLLVAAAPAVVSFCSAYLLADPRRPRGGER